VPKAAHPDVLRWMLARAEGQLVAPTEPDTPEPEPALDAAAEEPSAAPEPARPLNRQQRRRLAALQRRRAAAAGAA
jgi:hypothetical protein